MRETLLCEPQCIILPSSLFAVGGSRNAISGAPACTAATTSVISPAMSEPMIMGMGLYSGSAHGEDVVIVERGGTHANHHVPFDYDGVGEVSDVLQTLKGAVLAQYHCFHACLQLKSGAAVAKPPPSGTRLCAVRRNGEVHHRAAGEYRRDHVRDASIAHGRAAQPFSPSHAQRFTGFVIVQGSWDLCEGPREPKPRKSRRAGARSRPRARVSGRCAINVESLVGFEETLGWGVPGS